MKFHPRNLHGRALVKTLQKELVILSIAVLAFCAITIFSSMQAGFRSSELRFTDPSPSGMRIVPASCPSDPHYTGDCSTPILNNAPPQGYCSISSNPSYIDGNGDSSVLNWYVSDGTITILGVTAQATPANITLTSVGGVARSGSTSVSPTQTTTYTLSGNYTYLGAPVGNFSCSTVVSVNVSCPAGQVLLNGQCVTTCPAGQHASGGFCLCDDTNYVPNSAGQCTIEQCPIGYQWVNGQCVAVNQCQLPTSCADDTHVLDQCTGVATDCTAVYGAGWFCQAGACHRPVPPTATISAIPSLVPPNRTSNVTWSSANTSSCFVTGSNGDGAGGTWNTRSGSQTTSPITSQTTYTLKCTGFDGTKIVKSVTVSVIPNWQEQ